MADAWTQFWGLRAQDEAMEAYCARAIASRQPAKAFLEGQRTLGLFRDLPAGLIERILLKAHHSPLLMSKLPRFAMTCKLFYILTLENVKSASTSDLRSRLPLLACSNRLTALWIPVQRRWDDESLAAVVRRLPRLESLDLCAGHDFPQTLAALQACPRLSSIKTTFPEASSLAAFAAVRTLSALHVQQCASGSPGYREAAAALSPCSSLRQLEWHRRECDDPAPLLGLTQLTRLLVHFDNYNTAVPLWGKPGQLTLSPILRSLTITGSMLPPMTAIHMALCSSEVRALWLEHVPPPDVLLAMRRLSELTIPAPRSGAAAADAVARDLARCLPRLQHLRSLRLKSWNTWSGAKFRNAAELLDSILAVLPQCRPLRSLALEKCEKLSTALAAPVCTAMLVNAWKNLELVDTKCEPRALELIQACAARGGVQ